MTRDSTFGLYPDRLAQLLAIGSAPVSLGGDKPADEAASELLRDRLAGPLPREEAVVDSLPVLLGRLCRELLPLMDRALGDVLLDPTTTPGIFETIKDYAKTLSQRWEEGPEHAVAVAVYYAAIAAALVFHDRKITARSYARLMDSLDMLIDAKWMDPQLAKLLADARELCDERR